MLQIIAWRPLPADAKETVEPDEIPSHKDPLPREYLVKWVDRGFQHVSLDSSASVSCFAHWIGDMGPTCLAPGQFGGEAQELPDQRTFA